MVLEYAALCWSSTAASCFRRGHVGHRSSYCRISTYVVENRERVLGVILTHGTKTTWGVAVFAEEVDRAGLRHPSDPRPGERQARRARSEGKASLNEVLPARPWCWAPHHRVPGGMPQYPDGVGLVCTPRWDRGSHRGFQAGPDPDRLSGDRDAAVCRTGKERVLLLLSDSTNADVPGFAAPERSVGEESRGYLRARPGAIIVASFASHIHRIQQVMDIAARHGRSAAVVVEVWSRTSTSLRTWATSRSPKVL